MASRLVHAPVLPLAKVEFNAGVTSIMVHCGGLGV